VKACWLMFNLGICRNLEVVLKIRAKLHKRC
jgi:hypothetical protein